MVFFFFDLHVNSRSFYTKLLCGWWQCTCFVRNDREFLQLQTNEPYICCLNANLYNLYLKPWACRQIVEYNLMGNVVNRMTEKYCIKWCGLAPLEIFSLLSHIFPFQLHLILGNVSHMKDQLDQWRLKGCGGGWFHIRAIFACPTRWAWGLVVFMLRWS